MVSPPTTLRRLPSRQTLTHVNLNVDIVIANLPIEDLRAITRSLLASGGPNTIAAFCTSARTHIIRTEPKSLPSPSSLFAEHFIVEDVSDITPRSRTNMPLQAIPHNTPALASASMKRSKSNHSQNSVHVSGTHTTSSTHLLPSQSPKTPTPTPELHRLLAHARVLAGVGLNVEALKALTCIVRGTIGRYHIFAPLSSPISFANSQLPPSYFAEEQSEGNVFDLLAEVDCDIAAVIVSLGYGCNTPLLFLDGAPPNSNGRPREFTSADWAMRDLKDALNAVRAEAEALKLDNPFERGYEAASGIEV